MQGSGKETASHQGHSILLGRESPRGSGPGSRRGPLAGFPVLGSLGARQFLDIPRGLLFL